MNKLAFATFYITIAVLGSYSVALPYIAVLAHRSVTTDSVLADVKVSWMDGRLRIDARFESEKGAEVHAQCLSAYRDLIYELRNGSGALIPQKPGATQKPWNEQAVVSPARSGTPIPCDTLVGDEAHRIAFLNNIYPNLQPGLYTLRIIFAPRGSSGRAMLAPVRLSVDEDHLL